jgi:glycine/D-amino acid oxidase-like deaminating enzyme
MKLQTPLPICVVGAGIVGLTTAWHLLQRGHTVVLIDPEPFGYGASQGNATTLSTYAVTPVAMPGLWARIPSLLFSEQSPFTIRWKRVPRLLPWLWRFLRESLPARARRNATVLSQLLASAMQDWESLLGSLEARSLLVRRGCLYFYRTPDWERDASAEIELRAELGVRQQILSAQQVADLEPALAGRSSGGIFFPDAAHIDDPSKLLQCLRESIKTSGGSFLQARVTRICTKGSNPVLETNAGSVAALKVVVAAGAWSSTLAQSVGDYIPLDTERGYHLEFPVDPLPLSRPCCPVGLAFYMTPLTGRLRVAVTVELGSIDDPINERRLEFLRQGAQLFFDKPLGKPSSRWLGFRPSMPDSVPVIGPSPSDARVIYAFGHGHLGLTMAATTGRLVAEVISDTAPDWLAKCGAARFG